MYNVHSDLDNPLHDIAVVDCRLLASGHKFTGSHYKPSHQTFSCEECTGLHPHADFDFAGANCSTSSPTYYGMMGVTNYCDKADIMIDGSASTCEKAYWVRVTKINTASWSFIGPPIFAGWIDFDGEVPNDLSIASYLPPGFSFDYFGKYLLTLTVSDTGPGGTVHSEHKLFSVSPVCCFKTSENADKVTSDMEEQDLTVYPNPTKGVFTLSVENNDETSSFSIVNVLGQIIKEGDFQSNIRIDISDQNAGVFIVNVQNEKGIMSKRIIVE